MQVRKPQWRAQRCGDCICCTATCSCTARHGLLHRAAQSAAVQWGVPVLVSFAVHSLFPMVERLTWFFVASAHSVLKPAMHADTFSSWLTCPEKSGSRFIARG